MQDNPHHNQKFGLILKATTIADADTTTADISLPAAGEDLVIRIIRTGANIGAAFAGSTLSVKLQGKLAGGSYEDVQSPRKDTGALTDVQFDTTATVAANGTLPAFATGSDFQTKNVVIGTIPMNSVAKAADGSEFVAYRLLARDPSAGGEAIAIEYEWHNLYERPSGSNDYLLSRVRYT